MGGSFISTRAVAFAAALAAAICVTAPAGGAITAAKCSVASGDAFIAEGRYDQAVREFTCVIDAQPTEVEGYRGRIEAELLLARFSDAVRDYTRVTAFVEPLHPDAVQTIRDGYAARLAIAPDDVIALTGASFAIWWDFDYASASHMLNHLLELRPNDVYGNLFRGSSRMLRGGPQGRAAADLDRAIALAPESPDVRYIVADAYTYGLFDPERAFAEATIALEGGLDTPRVHAILGAAYNAFGDLTAAASEIRRHFELVTTQLVPTSPLASRESLTLDLVPGRVYEIPVAVTAGQTLSIATSSHDYFDTIAVLLAPDGTPLVGSDDANGYFAAFEWVAPATAVYRLQVTFFESVITGELVVARG
jgi:tetratricopeptide (TPR) repeat protein